METSELSKNILELSPSAEIITSQDLSKIVYVNKAFSTLLGLSPEHISGLSFVGHIVHTDGIGNVGLMRKTAIKNGVSESTILPIIKHGGKILDYYARCASVADEQRLIWSGIDVRHFTMAEQRLSRRLERESKNVAELKAQEFKLNFALQCAQSLSWELDTVGNKIVFSDTFSDLMGIHQSDYGYDFGRFLHTYLKPYEDSLRKSVADLMAGKISMLELELSMYDIDGNVRWFVMRGKPLVPGDITKVYGVSVDITDRKMYEQRLSDIAYKDSLTGLYKIEFISDALAGRVDSLKLSEIGLMALDICRFGNINAAFGRDRGDSLLIIAANRLRALANGNPVVRVSNNEFLIVYNGVRGTSELELSAKKILAEFEKPFLVDGRQYYLNLKIGIAIPPESDSSFETLVKDVEMALHHIKRNEVSDICVINDQIRKNTGSLIRLGYELRRAVTSDEFYLDFQPVVGTSTRKMVGAEALIRWNHPQRGIISPFFFIPLAEETGLINQIGDFVLEQSMRRLRKWLELDSGFWVSINISAIQFMSHGLVSRMRELMRIYNIPPANIVAEVTESVFISDMTHTISILRSLREMGIRISLDDFGTGYSSLSYLKKIPLDSLKIDRSFLLDVISDHTAEAILRAIISLGQGLSLSITAEGVETPEQLSLLEKLGCDYIQGYYFSKPVAPEKIDGYLAFGIDSRDPALSEDLPY